MDDTHTPVPGKPEPDPEVLATLGVDEGTGSRRWWVLAAVVLVVAVAGVLLFGARQRQPADPRFTTDEVKVMDLAVEVTATGTVSPQNQVDVGTEVSGRVKDVLVDFNDQVKVGQVLARLDTEVLSLQVKQAAAQAQTARATWRQAKAALDEARKNAIRTRGLAQKNLVASADLERAEAALARATPAVDVAAAQMRTTRATLEMAEANLRRAEVKSPIDGIVIARMIEPGQVVMSALQSPVLFRLAKDLQHMELSADIDEADVGRIQKGQAAQFTVAAFPNKTFAAKLTDVYNAPKAYQQVVTYQALFDVDNPDGLLRPGMTATVRITTAVFEDVVTVPNAALRFVPKSARGKNGTNPRPTEDTVWVVGDDGRERSRTVKTLGTDGKRTVVQSDELAGGDLVIVAERELTRREKRALDKEKDKTDKTKQQDPPPPPDTP